MAKVAVTGVVGRTNAGKSTLVNRLVGEKVSIVSPVEQTTRNTIRGIVASSSLFTEVGGGIRSLPEYIPAIDHITIGSRIVSKDVNGMSLDIYDAFRSLQGIQKEGVGCWASKTTTSTL